MLRFLRRLLAPTWEPESVRHLKRLAEQLNDKATRFRAVASRAVLLEQRIGFLETESKTWEQRAAAVRGTAIASDVARICGRMEGQLDEAQAELRALQADETHLRSLLTSGRRSFAEGVEHARSAGYDVSSCLLYVDLTRPECPADETLLGDDDRRFVARVIDGGLVH